ncbi:MAG: leucine-rich repeat domain-containing protein [Alistipes sp.]|nr:leucine-rich repeat domain-containing protein [Alistipes sp.]
MKKLLLFIATLSAFAACTTDTTEDVAQIVVPDCLQVSIADEESRMQLSNGKTVWTEGDKVSVFYKSDANQCWKFNGKTGDRSGTLSCVSQGTATTKMEKVVIVYPYSESYMITPSSGNIEAKLPAVQKYLQGSYGLESSPMISSGYYTQFALKNVCGWLKLQLSGTGTITKITLKGNNGEQLAGDMYINAEDATVTLASASVDNDDNQETGGTLVFEDSIVREVELDCDGGVDLSGADVTPFYIALPPTVFEKGFTATLHFDNGMQKEISTSKKVEITRNHIVPMEETDATTVPTNQIWYTSSDGEIITRAYSNFGAKLVSNTYENGKGVLTFDGEITTIPMNAFHGCYQLTSIAIPENITSIKMMAFYKCVGLTSIKIPDSVTLIEYGVFDQCSNLTSITIGEGVTEIGKFAFQYCISLTSITIPDNVSSIGEGAFLDCNNLTTFYGKYASADNRCLIMDGKLVAFAPAGLTEYNIPDGVTEIEKSSFCNYRNLTNITIPDSVTSIGGRAFSNCSRLTSITIPDSVTEIGEYAFNVCSQLEKITLGNNVKSIGNGVFSGCNKLSSITIPDSVTEIGELAFYCANLTSFYGKYASPDSRCLIIDGKLVAFARFGLTEYTIPNDVTSIGNSTFYSCNNLTSITIPDSVTKIEDFSFYVCSKLTSITIPDRITWIGERAFANCSSLTSIYCPSTTPPTLSGDVFSNISSTAKIYVPTASVDAYKSAENWSSYASIITGYDFNEQSNE